MSKLIKCGNIPINKLESVHIVKSFKEIKDLELHGNYNCSIRSKHNLRVSRAPGNLCMFNGSACRICFYKANNFLNVHKLIKRLKNEQANKLSKA